MIRLARLAHAGLAWLFVVAIVVQVFLAGAALVNLGGTGEFGTHIEFGYVGLGLLALALLISAILGRVGRTSFLVVIGLVVLYVVQTSLPFAKADMPAVAALHPVNALFLFALAVVVARRATAQIGAAVPVEPSPTGASEV